MKGLPRLVGSLTIAVPPLLIAYLIAEVLFMVLISLATLRRRQPA